MSYRLPVFIILCIITLILLTAQSIRQVMITGKIVDSGFKKGISYALITISKDRSSIEADSMGNFKMYVNPNGHIEISILGFHSKRISVAEFFTEENNYYYEIELEKNVFAIDEVIIHSLGTWEDFKEKMITGNISDPLYQQQKYLYNMFRPYYQEAPDYKNYGYIPYFRKPNMLSVIFHPANAFGYFFNKEDKEKRRIYALIKGDEKYEKYSHIYNEQLIATVTDLKNDSVRLFKNWIDKKTLLDSNRNEYNIILQILKYYKEYKTRKIEK